MSLKAFHIIFILASILLCFGFAWWEFGTTGHVDSTGLMIAGGISALIGIGLIVYLVLIIRKFRSIKS